MIKLLALVVVVVALALIMVTKGDEFSILLTNELYVVAYKTLQGLKLEHCKGRLLTTTLLYMYCLALGKAVKGQSTLRECVELL